jgi:hypothetical protein
MVCDLRCVLSRAVCRHGAMRSPVMRSPEEPSAAGSAAAMARQRYKHERTGMHVLAGQQRPTRGGMTAREMVRDALSPSPVPPCSVCHFTCGSPHSVC